MELRDIYSYYIDNNGKKIEQIKEWIIGSDGKEYLIIKS